MICAINAGIVHIVLMLLTVIAAMDIKTIYLNKG